MWLFNKDTNTWVKQTDSLSLYNYNNLKQDLASVKLYSKALSGANYLAISDVNNIYESITYKDCKTWYIDPSSSIYSIGSIPSNGVSINRNSIDNFIKYTEEYGFTLKNNFTPEKAIDDMNLLQVDVATTQLIDLNSNIVSIDGVKLVEGNTILVKDQISTVDLSFTVDPAIYFEGNYYLVSNNISDDTYQYYSPDNGIYKYTNGKLVKSLLKDYGNYRDLSVNIKQGSINSGKQFHLSRLLNGYFPSEGDPIEFKEKHSYLVRHQTDYHNLFENNYLDVLKHGTQSLSIDSSIYTIPERLIYVGDFGVILVSQDGMQPQYLYNDYKYNLKNIIEVGENYWTCGDSGVILKISKIDLKISKVDLGKEFNTLTSIDFIDTLRGIVVGKYNTIYTTFDGGYNWNKVSFDVQNYSYNKVIYYSYTTIYISGENGVFLELNYTDISSNKWSLTQRNIVKYLTTSDEYELIEDINTMFHASFTASWNLNYSGVTGLGISSLKDCLFFGTNNNNLIVYEINNFVPEFNFIYLSFSQSLGDITSVTLQEGTSNIIVSGNDTISFDVNQFNKISISSNLISSLGTFSVLSSTYSNQIFDYNGSVLYSACNMGVISGYDYTSGAFNIQAAAVSPKFLLMEYDMADKLNFFDSNYNYIVPNMVTFSQFNGLTSSFLTGINLDFDQNTWLDYVSANVYKTYGINTGSLTDPVTLNSSFMYYTYSSITFSNSSICSDYTQFKGMYPYVGSTQSKYSTFTFASASVVSTLYAYKNIFIFNLSTDFCSVGDILQINAQDFQTNVMVNAYHTGGFFYAFNDINNSMMNSLLSTPVITLTNLNKFSDISNYTDLLINFQEHPFSTGYELTFDNSLFAVNSLFNNETAYKSLETNVWTQYSGVNVHSVVGASGPGNIDGPISSAKITRPGYCYYYNDAIYFPDGGTGSFYDVSNPDTWRRYIKKLDLNTNIVTTIAGTVTPGTTHSGDGGLAINAGLYNPTAITFDTTGNMYFTEFGGLGNYVRKIDTSGIITTIMGIGTVSSIGDGGPAIYAGLNQPQGIDIDQYGNLYVLDSGNNKVRKIDTSGTVTTYISGLSTPNCLKIFNNTLYISNGVAHTILSANLDIGPSSLSVYINTADPSINVYPSSICIDNLGNTYFSGEYLGGHGKVFFKNAITGIITLIAGGGVLTGDGHPPLLTDMDPLTVTVDGLNNIYFNDAFNSLIREIIYNSALNSGYSDSYNSFGYVPNYNLLNYLNNINNVFTASKVFHTMPQYVGLPGNNAGGFTYSNIYYDSNSGTSWPRNQIMFGSGLKYEWDTLWVNTFVDLTITTTLGTYVRNQMLIINKYYDTNLDGYIITFNDRILSVTNTGVISVSIVSRNSLEQISDDLKLFDSLNKPYINKSYHFNYYENPIKTKINTDSYTKILLSDGDIKKYLTGIIYTNADNKLLLNTINVNTTRDIVINNTFNYSSLLGLNTIVNNDVSTEQLAFITFNGGTGSSQQLNPSYSGVHNINPIDDYNIYVNTPHLSDPSVSDTGLLRLYNFDPFFNYNPVSLIDVGFDGMYKIPIKLQENNLLKQGLSASLINYSTNKPVFRLLNGLDINQISTNYHWLLEAEITDGIIGLDTNGIVWYSGIWESGRWFGGTWYSGQWLSGDWYNGTWSSMYITDNIISIEIGKNTISNESSIWYNGRWFDGTWNGGTWLNGRRYNGDWNNGLWYNGIWNDGNWHKGQFMGGIWVQGNWDTGIFNSSNKPSFWINGKFNSGDFQNGMWYNGEFGQNYSVLSKFGALASNSRNATWHGGVFASGNFYSYENISATDSTITVSDVHKYSVWKTGIFSQGNFYGGIVYNMNCQNGIWHGGIVQDIEIIGVSSPSASTVTLNGVFRFNIGDYINIIGDGSTTAYYNLGNYNNPGKYRIANSYIDLSKNWTVITLDYNFSTLAFTSPYNATASYNVNTGMRAVSRFKDTNWKSGIWYNGVFESGAFESGIWYDGLFMGTWG